MSCFNEWTCVHPGKGHICWKRATSFVGTKEEAEAEANKWANVVAVPLHLADKIDEYNRRTVAAEQLLDQVYFLLHDKRRATSEYQRDEKILNRIKKNVE